MSHHPTIPCFDIVCAGTERARGLAQTLLNVPYGEEDGEKLDVYIPKTNSLGMHMSENHDTNTPPCCNALYLQKHTRNVRINRPDYLYFRCQPCYLHTWRLLAVSQVQSYAFLCSVKQIPTSCF